MPKIAYTETRFRTRRNRDQEGSATMSKGTSLYAPTETGDLVRKFAKQAGVGTGRYLEFLVEWSGEDAAQRLADLLQAMAEIKSRHRVGKSLPAIPAGEADGAERK